MRTGQLHQKWFVATCVMGAVLASGAISACSSSSHDVDGGMGGCPPGTQPPLCSECKVGMYCPGGDTKGVSCPPGTEDTDMDPATPCKLASQCPAGSYLMSMTPRFGGQTQMPSCQPCPSGTFSTAPDSNSCMQWTNCQPGEYVAEAGSSTQDRTCQSCAQGTNSSAQNAARCTTQSECAAGTQPSNGVTMCSSCQPGYYCPGGNAAAQPCGPVTWDHDQNPASACVPRDTCSPGSYVTDAGSTTTRRTCATCTAGTYSDSTNSPSCTPCASGTYNEVAGSTQCLPYSPCSAGFSPSQPGTATSNQVCASCSAGTYCAGDTAGAVSCTGDTWDNDLNPSTACATKTDCAAGQYVTSDGSSTSDRSCATCTSGSFSDASNSSSCATWSECSAGTYVSNTPSASADRVCGDCASGTYSTTANAGSCTQWTPCDAGSAGSGGSTTSDQSCSACSAGQYCAGGTSPAEDCGNGTWDDDSNPSTACAPWTSCAVGSGVNNSPNGTTDATCAACTGDTFSDVNDATACQTWTTCAAGTYVNNTPSASIDRSCAQCPGGTVSTTENASGCTTCPGGTAPNSDQSGCE